MSVTFKQSPNLTISWIIVDSRSGYSATWYLYEEKFMSGIVVRCETSTAVAEEPLPAWFVMA